MYKSSIEINHRHNQTKNVSDIYSTLKNVELNIIDSCNRTCDYCPHSLVDYNFNRQRAELSLFVELSNQLKDYTGSITLCGYGEPTMHKKLLEIVAILRNTKAKLELTSNSELLDIDKVKQLFINGLDFLNLSIYELKYLEHAKELVADLDPSKYMLRYRYLNQIQIVDRKTILKDIVSNRTNKCYLPSYKCMINHNGDVLLCCNDWSRQYVYGNIFTDNIYKIWTENMLDKRLELLKAENISGPCTKCNINGTEYGIESARFYENNYLR